MVHKYLKDPSAIYRQSFEIVRREANLSGFSGIEERVTVRLIHAIGNIAIADRLRFSDGAVERGIKAIKMGAPILCDCKMVRSGLSLKNQDPTNNAICLIDEPKVGERAKQEATTRSSAQVPLWKDIQDYAVVAIGNAPTALYRLIEEIEKGGPMPAIVLGFPVGFVGAAESKKLLHEALPEIPHVTLLGRQGGSALAAAAVNALSQMAMEIPE